MVSDDPRDFGDQPDGPISGLFWEYDRRLTACDLHATAEGHDVHPRAVLEGYDRTLHPWIRGWRVGEIGDTLRAKYRRAKQLLAVRGPTTTDGETA